MPQTVLRASAVNQCRHTRLDRRKDFQQASLCKLRKEVCAEVHSLHAACALHFNVHTLIPPFYFSFAFIGQRTRSKELRSRIVDGAVCSVDHRTHLSTYREPLRASMHNHGGTVTHASMACESKECNILKRCVNECTRIVFTKTGTAILNLHHRLRP